MSGDPRDPFDIHRRVDDVEDDQLALRTDLTGERGTNGKIGTLRSEVQLLRKLVIALLACAISVGTASIWDLVQRGTDDGSDHAKLERAEKDIRDLRADVDTLRGDPPRARVTP